MKKVTRLFALLASTSILASCGVDSVSEPASETDGTSEAAPAEESSVAQDSSVEESAPAESSAEEGESLFSGPVEIEFRSTFSYEAEINQLISDFQEIYPEVTITYNKYSGNYNSLKENVLDSISANNLPNIVSCYPDHVAEYLDEDIVVNLKKYMDAEGKSYAWTQDDYDDFVPGLVEQGSSFIRKGTYMLPHSPSTEGMYYNENILGKTFEFTDENGTHKANDGNPIDTEYLNNITWEELLGVLAPGILAYNAEHDNCFLDTTEGKPSAVVNYSGSDNAFVTFCAQKEVDFSRLDKASGTGEITFNETSTMRDTLKEFNGYYREDLFSTAGIESQTNVNVNEYRYAVFATGSTGGLKYQIPSDGSFETGVMRVPTFEGQDHKVISQGPGLCAIKTGTDDQQLASYLFINFINQPENTLFWALSTGYFPTRQSCYETEDYIEACEVGTKTGLEALKAKTYQYANNIQEDFFTNYAFKGSASARSYAGSLFDTVVGYNKGELTDEIISEEFENTINEIKKKM